MSVLTMLALVACQHPSTSVSETRSEAWRVLERVGDVRVTEDNGRTTSQVRPGDAVGDGGRVTVGSRGLLILSRNDAQLTAGENTALRLVAHSPGSSVILDRGWLRARFNTPVDRTGRIRTADFDINASSATLTIRADRDRSDLSIDDGNVTFATVDGRHQATLVAGAAARIDREDGSALMIRPASGQAFSRIAPLRDAGRRRGESTGPSAWRVPDGGKREHWQDAPGDRGPDLVLPTHNKKSIAGTPSAAALHDDGQALFAPKTRRAMPTIDGRPRAATPPSGDQLAILPASRLKTSPQIRSRAPSSTEWTDLQPARLAQTPTTAASASSQYREGKENEIARSTSWTPGNVPQDPPGVRPAAASDPLQLKFDRLTEGLLEGL